MNPTITANNTTTTTTSNIGYWSVYMKTKEQIVAELLKKKHITTEEAACLLQKEIVYVPQTPAYPTYPWNPWTNQPVITYANNSNAN